MWQHKDTEVDRNYSSNYIELITKKLESIIWVHRLLFCTVSEHLISVTLYLIEYYIVTIVFSSIHWFFSVNMSEFNAKQCLSKHYNKSVLTRNDILSEQHFSIISTVNRCCE